MLEDCVFGGWSRIGELKVIMICEQFSCFTIAAIGQQGTRGRGSVQGKVSPQLYLYMERTRLGSHSDTYSASVDDLSGERSLTKLVGQPSYMWLRQVNEFRASNNMRTKLN